MNAILLTFELKTVLFSDKKRQLPNKELSFSHES